MKINLIVLSFFLSHLLLGQSNLSTNPFSLKWRQIDTPRFRVIYPTGSDNAAQQTAKRLEQLYEINSASLAVVPKKIPIVLQNQTNVSNGFVTLAPRHSEFYLTSPQDASLLGTLNWIDQLSIHEFRHVAQFDKARIGFTNIATKLFGTYTLAGLTVLIPNWFYEGDAVCNETFLSASGRGRIPAFDVGFRTRLLTDNGFDYSKATCGSLKDFVPNHYVLGYLLTSELKKDFGPNIWADVLKQHFSKIPYPFSFSNAIKKVTKQSVDDWYATKLINLKKEWQTQLDSSKTIEYEPIKTSVNRAYTDYLYPKILEDSSILAVKVGYRDIPKLIIVKDGKEKNIKVLGLWNDSNTLSVQSSKIVWAEFNPDPRWARKDYSVIKLHDLSLQKTTQLTFQTKYAAPSLSPDAKQIAVVNTDLEGRNQLIVLSATNGSILKVFENNTGNIILQPCWLDQGNLLAITLNQNGKSISIFNLDSTTKTEIKEFGNINISNLCVQKDFIYFNAPISGIDNIYALELSTKNVYMVTNERFGAYNLSVSKSSDDLVFNVFRNDGYKIVQISKEKKTWKKIETFEFAETKYFGRVGSFLENVNSLKPLAEQSLPSKLYSKWNIINPYSWNPMISSSFSSLNYGVTSQDLLSTTVISTGFSYNMAEKTNQFIANVSYQGLYPIIELGYQNGGRATTVAIDKQLPIDSLRSGRWNQEEVSLTTRIPFNFTNSQFVTKMNLELGINYMKAEHYDLPQRSVLEMTMGETVNLNLGFSFSKLQKLAKQDLQPRLGYSLFFVNKNTPFVGSLKASQFATGAIFYLPGFFAQHGIRLRTSFQRDQNSNYRFGNRSFYPRGQSFRISDQLLTLLVDYKLPLLLPDLKIGRLVYIQRVFANLFVDQAQSKLNIKPQGVNTSNTTVLGIDLVFDFNIMRFPQKFQVGARTLFSPSTREFLIQPLILDIGI